MNYQRNVNSILPTQLPHKFSYIVVILIHNHFESEYHGYYADLNLRENRFSHALTDLSSL
jgi:hypothetical protein